MKKSKRLLVTLFIIATLQHIAQVSAWSNKYDNLGYGEVIGAEQDNAQNLYIGSRSDYANVYIPGNILHWNKLTEQVTFLTGNASLVNLKSIKLVNDTVLYVCGILSVNNIPTNFAKLNVVTKVWTPLGSVTSNGGMYVLERIGNKIYIGGQFAQINNTLTAKSICSYDFVTSTFDSVPGPLYQTISQEPVVKVLKNINNKLFVGGTFIGAGALTLNSVGLWNGVSWQSMNGGLISNIQNSDNVANVTCAVKDTLNPNDLYVGGQFTKANNIVYYPTPWASSDCIMKWKSSTGQWDTIPFIGAYQNNSVFNTPYNMSSIQLYKNKLYCGFITGTTTNYNGGNYFVNSFSASGWQLVPIALNLANVASQTKTNLFVYQNELLISCSNTRPINGMLRYSGSGPGYKSFGNGFSLDNAYQYSYGKISEDQSHIYVTNNTIEQSSTGNIKNFSIVRMDKATAQWDSLSSWKPFPVINSRIKGDTICVVGQANYTPSTYTMGACWNKVTKVWSPLFQSSTNFTKGGDKINDIVFYGNGFFIGGSFAINYSSTLRNIAYYNGTAWDSILKAPFNGEINSMQITNDTLWVGGNFCISTNTPLLNFAAYKISTKQWINMGNFLFQVNPDCNINNNYGTINEVKVYKNKIFVTGKFMYYRDKLGNQASVLSGAGYFNRATLAYTSFSDFQQYNPYHLNSFNTSYVESDSIIYLGGSENTYKNFQCYFATNTQCDSAWNVVRYNHILNKFSRLAEYGVYYKSPYNTNNISYPYVNGITSFNNKLFITGYFNKAGQYYNSSGVAFYTIPYAIGNPVGFDSFKTSDELAIFPNPGSNLFFLKTNKIINYIQVFDIRGELISTVYNINKIDLSGKPEGIYIIKAVFTDQSQAVGKIIKIN